MAPLWLFLLGSSRVGGPSADPEERGGGDDLVGGLAFFAARLRKDGEETVAGGVEGSDLRCNWVRLEGVDLVGSSHGLREGG